jgi:uncharacterized metal-binding protein
MVDLPKKKVGIVACSGEELAEGTVTRLAALKVLEQLRPQDTVTICLPLFLAGGEGDRAFARFYPTIAVDGCELRCAARATEMYSGKPAASLVVTELVEAAGLPRPQGLRRLDQSGNQAVELTARQIAGTVDELLGQKWNRRVGADVGHAVTLSIDIGQADSLPYYAATGSSSLEIPVLQEEPVQATCSCGSGIPVRKLVIEGQPVTLVALPLIFQNFCEQGKPPGNGTARELLDAVKIYNPIPAGSEAAYEEALMNEYTAFCTKPEAVK